MSKTLTKKALLQKAKARLSGGDSQSAEAFLLANKLKITGATLEFNGSGDSGDFYHPMFEGKSPPDRMVQDKDGNWGPNPKFVPDYERLSEILKHMSEKWVEGTGVDWYNNDGGGGELTFNFKTGEVSANVYYYEQVRHDADSGEWNLLDDNEGEDE